MSDHSCKYNYRSPAECDGPVSLHYIFGKEYHMCHAHAEMVRKRMEVDGAYRDQLYKDSRNDRVGFKVFETIGDTSRVNPKALDKVLEDTRSNEVDD